MSENYQIQLKSATIKKVPLRSYNEDFTFIVNGEEFKTSRIISDLLSPKISQNHYTDSTLDTFTINTTNKGNFSLILDLINFETLEISPKEFPFISEVLKFLGNDLTNVICTREDEEMTISNIISLLKLHSNSEINLTDSIEREIEFASENFSEILETINEDEFEKLDLNILMRILTHENFVLKDEDQLLKFVNHMYSKSRKYLTLYETVIFTNATSESMKEFIEIIDMNDITNSMWIELSNRLKKNINFIENSDEKHQNKIKNSFRYKGKFNQGIILLKDEKDESQKFDGIIKFLINKSKNQIEMSASSVENQSYGPENVISTTNTYNWSYFHSKDLQNSWICFDFKDNRIIPDSYEIKTYPYSANDQHAKSWVIEVSNDSSSWFVLDEMQNCSYLNGRSFAHTFKIKNKTSQKFRYFRMRLTGPNWLGKNSLAIKSFEIYGSLFMNNEI